MYKQKVREMLESGEITITELASVMSDFASSDHEKSSIYNGHEVLDNLNGWIVDDEMAIGWGVNKLMNRMGYDKGFVIATEVMFHAREAALKEMRECDKIRREI